jgi:chaperonin GroES
MTSLSLRPLGDRVVVEPIDQEDMTPSGIFLPETAKERPQKGAVVAVGPGARNDEGVVVPLDVKPGDKVIYAKYGGTEFKLGSGKTVLILRESDLLAILVD